MTLPPRVLPLVREFRSNGMKYLLSSAANVADLLRWREPKIARRIDFTGLEVQPDTYVSPDFASLESDVLLRAPFGRSRKREELTVYVLMENQAEPDELMPFRALRYVVLIYERQASQWRQEHGNLRGFRFHPVLPVVVYTGRRRWPRLPTMASLVHRGELFGKRIPEIEPVFLDLARTEAEVLRGEVGTLGWVLWLIQQSAGKRGNFRTTLAQVVGHLDALGEDHKTRWEELLWFAHALVYHSREGSERDELAEHIRATVRASRQAEVTTMRQTIAELYRSEGKAEGKAEGKQEALLLLLRTKYEVPTEIEARVRATTDMEKLDDWIARFVTARKLTDIPFGNGK